MLARLGRGVSVIRSTSHNVYYNLALEEYLREKLIWREGDELARVLLLYVNKPAVRSLSFHLPLCTQQASPAPFLSLSLSLSL